MADHFARDDHHALAIVRRIVANLNRDATTGKTKIFFVLFFVLNLFAFSFPVPPSVTVRPVEEPRYSIRDIGSLVPTDTRTQFDVRGILARILDGSRFDEFKRLFGDTLVTGFGRLWGFPVGIVANNGILFSSSAQKGAHFIELCAQVGEKERLRFSSVLLKGVISLAQYPSFVYPKHYWIYGWSQS